MSKASMAVIIALAAGSPVAAQTLPGVQQPGLSTFDRHRIEADRHRQEMDRLRMQSDQRQAFVRQLETDTRLNRLDAESRRQPDPYTPPATPRLRSPEEERAAREAATERRRRTSEEVGQIDAWLDRLPN
jgi:hypothetical protein